MAIQMYARYEVEVVGYTTDSVQIRFTAGPKDLCCWVPRDSLPLEEPIGGNPMNDSDQLISYDGIVGLGDPKDCPIVRFYRDCDAEPGFVLQSAWAAKGQVDLNAAELVALYDALTPRIAYLRECAKREAEE